MEIELRRAVGLLDHLGKLAWLEGEEITITNKGKPYLKLIAHPDGDPSQAQRKPMQAGSRQDEMWITPEFFEEDMDIIEAFEGKYSNDYLFEPFLLKSDSHKDQAEDSSV